MSDELNPITETQQEFELDPYYKSHQDQQNERVEYWKDKEEEDIENSEVKTQTEEEPVDKFSDAGDVVRGTLETALQPVLGVGDFASDAVGIVPWLKPIDDWWDKHSYRSTHPGHKLIRDASSIIIPSLVGGTLVTGGA